MKIHTEGHGFSRVVSVASSPPSPLPFLGEGDNEVVGEGVYGTAAFHGNAGRALPLF
ncbi:MAG: hypothetical protein ACRD18_17865 [Terriglobia bacterium]